MFRESEQDFELRYHKTLRLLMRSACLYIKVYCTAIVGESGCGKRYIGEDGGLLEPVTEGAIYYKGQQIGGIKEGRPMSIRGEALRAYRQHVQMIFQDPVNVFSPRMKIGTFLMEPWIHFEKKTKKEAREMALYSLRRVASWGRIF